MRSTLSVEYGGGPSILLHNVSSSPSTFATKTQYIHEPCSPAKGSRICLLVQQYHICNGIMSCIAQCINLQTAQFLESYPWYLWRGLSPDQSSVAGALASNPLLMTRISDIYGRDSLGLVTRSIVCCSRIGLGLGLVQQHYNISLPGAEDTM